MFSSKQRTLLKYYVICCHIFFRFRVAVHLESRVGLLLVRWRWLLPPHSSFPVGWCCCHPLPSWVVLLSLPPPRGGGGEGTTDQRRVAKAPHILRARGEGKKAHTTINKEVGNQHHSKGGGGEERKGGRHHPSTHSKPKPIHTHTAPPLLSLPHHPHNTSTPTTPRDITAQHTTPRHTTTHETAVQMRFVLPIWTKTAHDATIFNSEFIGQQRGVLKCN